MLRLGDFRVAMHAL